MSSIERAVYPGIYRCIEDFHMVTGERVYTKGKQYAFVHDRDNCLLSIDDEGEQHTMCARHILSHFVCIY